MAVLTGHIKSTKFFGNLKSFRLTGAIKSTRLTGIIEIFTRLWILEYNYWEDAGAWIDTKNWND